MMLSKSKRTSYAATDLNISKPIYWFCRQKVTRNRLLIKLEKKPDPTKQFLPENVRIKVNVFHPIGVLYQKLHVTCLSHFYQHYRTLTEAIRN